MSFFLAIVGTRDNPLYKAEFGSYRQGNDGVSRFKDEARRMNEFIAHSTLDIVEEVQWRHPQLYMKAIDRFYNLFISVFLTPGNIKIMLLHETRNDEGIRQFFNDVYDLYVKCLLNPFYRVNDPITSPIFDAKVRASVKKYL